MSLRSGIVPLSELRGVVAARLSTMSLRGVARDVGMSPSGLQKFVDGAVPYPPTRQKLERWYVRETARGGDAPTPGVALAALDVLVGELAGPRRHPAARALVALLGTTYREEGGAVPGWLEELERELGSGPGE